MTVYNPKQRKMLLKEIYSKSVFTVKYYEDQFPTEKWEYDRKLDCHYRYIEYSDRGVERRMYPIQDGSLATQTKHIREKALCDIKYTEIDIVNCFPNIMVKICKEDNIQCPNWEYYCENRDSILKVVCEAYDKWYEIPLSADTSYRYSKQLFFKVLYGTNPFKKDCVYDNLPRDFRGLKYHLPIQTKFLLDQLQKESIKIFELLWEIPEYNFIRKYAEEYDYRTPTEDSYTSVEYNNLVTYFMYLLFAREERCYINFMMSDVKRHGGEIFCYLFDGFLVRGDISEKVLNECNEYTGMQHETLEEYFEYQLEIKVKITVHN